MSVDLFDSQWQDVRDLVSTTSENKQTPPAPDRRAARTAVKAQQRRADRHDAIAVWGEKRAAVRTEREATRAQARARRAERRADRAAAQVRLQAALMTLAQRVLVIGPILAPMAVAWTGQSQFAIRILGWPFIASLLYAAAYELTTVYWAWLYHQARTDGDSGWEYRLGTWVFAVGAALQQWWHYSDHWNATPRAVTYSVMSAVGVLLWEGRARLLHRRQLRAQGKLSWARPRIGLVRWARYPVRSWTAWSLTILEGHRTLDEAWAAADRHIADRRLRRAAGRAQRRADRADRKADRAQREADHRPASAQQDQPGPDQLGPDRRARPLRAGRRPGPARATVRPGGNQQRPARATAQQGSVESGPGPGLQLNDIERQALENLRASGEAVTKRSVAVAVRRMGQPIGTTRAADIARESRTLRTA